MGNKPRELPHEKLIESFHNASLPAVLSSGHEIFHQTLLGAPPPITLQNCFSQAPDSTLLELLTGYNTPPNLNSAIATTTTSSSEPASQLETVIGKGAHNHLHREPCLARKSWSSSPNPPSYPLWMLRHSLDKKNYPLPLPAGLVRHDTNSPKSSVIAEVRSGQTGQRVWCDGSRELAEDKISRLKLVNPDKLLAGSFVPGDSPSPRGKVISEDVADMDVKQMDSSDYSDQHMDEQEDKNPANSQSGMVRSVSKNLVSERKRRKKLNEGLYTLRALVPRISKMDKASIIGDAIDYVRELQNQVEELQAGISDMESKSGAALLSEELPSMPAESDAVQVPAGVSDNPCWEEDGSKSSESKVNQECLAVEREDSVEQKILELDVDIMEDQIYHLRIFCTKGPGVFVQLMQSLEALGLEVLNANLTSVSDNILNTFIAEVKDWQRLKTEEVKTAIMDVAARFGLQ